MQICKKTVIIILLIIINFVSFSQNYKKIHKIFINVYYADSLYKLGNYELSAKYYKKAINEDYLKSEILYNISECYYNLNDTIKTLKYYTKAIKSGLVYLDTSYITNNKINLFLKERLLIQYMDILYKNYESYKNRVVNINEELRFQFLERKNFDQQFRGKENSDSIWKIQKQYDEDNKKFLDNVISIYGWPSIDLLGEDGATAAFLFVQHADDDVKFQEKCLKLMSEKIKNINLQHYAMLMDRIMLKKYGFQLFGTQCRVINNKYNVRPLYDVKIVNVLRKYFNMPPIEIYLENMTKTFLENAEK